MSNNMILTYGLTAEENEQIRSVFSGNDYTLSPTDAYTDIIAIPCVAAIINANALTDEQYDILTSFYIDVAGGLYETVYWIGTPLPPKSLLSVVKCHPSFEQFSIKMKYCFLEAQRQYKKKHDFNAKLADCLKVLSIIQKKPHVQTKELAQALEKSTRTIVRYISTLQIAGEWIGYDYTTKGWYLEKGKSILFEQ